MNASLSGLPPVQLAIDGLEGSLAHMQIREQTRHKHEEIVSNLTNLAYQIQTQLVEKSPSCASPSIANVARAIEEQTIVAGGCRDVEDALSCYCLIGALLQRLHIDITLSTWDISQEQQMDSRLERLEPVYNAYHNAAPSMFVAKRTRCTEGTRVELLDATQTWIQEESAEKIYWLNGMAGTGKTTIAYSVCEMLQDKYRLGGSFFCSRHSPDCRNINRVIPTIAYQLARYSNPYRKVLCDVLRNDPDAAKRNIDAQFKQLILGPLTQISKAMPTDVVVVIDALDECTDADGTRDMLGMLFQYAGNLPIRFFISSRPEPQISDCMAALDGAICLVSWLHDIERCLVQADIKLYLIQSLKPARLRSSEIDQLAAHAGCLFIFAAAIVRYILPARGSVNQRQRIQAVLGLKPNEDHKVHQEIDELYTAILSNALDENIYEETELKARRELLWTVICAREPLPVAALGEILDMPSEDIVHITIRPLQSVLHLSKSGNMVTIFHTSFHDFLLNEKRAGQFYCDNTALNSCLANCCFNLLARCLRFNICALESSYQLDNEVPDLQFRVEKAISTGLLYSCRYWGDHLTVNQPVPSSLSFLESFLQNYLLFWMEVLNLKGVIGHGECVLSQVLGWLPAQGATAEIWELTYDARNFLTTFAGNPTSLSTPHIYTSTLPFTPNQSLVYRTYWPRTRGLVQAEGAGIDARGKSALATWVVGKHMSVYSLALSKDGTRVVSGSCPNGVNVWEVARGARILGPLGNEAGTEDGSAWEDDVGFVQSVAYSPDDTRIASGSSYGNIRIWHTQTGELITGPLDGHSQTVNSVTFSPNGAYLASGSDDMTIRIWDAGTGAPVGEPLQGHQHDVMPIAFSPDGHHLASGSADTTIRVWDWQKSTMKQRQLQGHTSRVYSITYSSDGHRLASGSEDRTVRVWDMSNGTPLTGPFEGHTKAVSAVAFSPNGTQVVSGSHDKTICVWEAVSGTLLAGPFKGHERGIKAILFTADGTRILSGADDGTIRVWDARPGTTGATEPSGHTGGILSVALSPDGTRVASGSDDQTICVWDTNHGALVAGPFQGHTCQVRSVAFSPDGARIVSDFADHTLCIWDASTGAVLVGRIQGHTSNVVSAAFSPDGTQIASGSHDDTIRLWNSHTGAPVAEPFRGHTSAVMSIAFSSDGARIVSGSFDKTVRTWDASDGTILWTSKAHTRDVNCVAFSPDGTRVVSGSDNILVLDARDGAVLYGPFTGHSWPVTSVAFSPDGTCFISGSYDQTVQVWDVKSGTAMAGPLKGHQSGVTSAAFSPDGARIISGSWDNTIRVWDLAAVAQAGTSDDWSIDDDGWLTNSHSQRLFWVPSDLRYAFGLLAASNPIVMNASCTTRIDPSTLLGDRWHECYGI